MDDTLHDRTIGRNETAHDAGDDSAASRDRAGTGTDSAADFVTVCGWCPNLHILKLQRRDVDVLVVYQLGKELSILRNGTKLKITTGICKPCSDRLHTDTTL